MIVTRFHHGQGLGNQLWCYVTTRVISLDKGYDFGILDANKFKGADFLKLDMGKSPSHISSQYTEKALVHPVNGADIRLVDNDLIHIADNTEIDGLMQGEQYISHHKDEIRQWLAVAPEHQCLDFASDDICVINFRGGGYIYDVDFFLPRRYWNHAIAHMRSIRLNIRFIVVTDDVRTAKKFFPSFEAYHWNIAKDYSVIHNAHYLIVSNSSFAWFPAWTSSRLKMCIAPKYWGRYNTSDGYWSLGTNITKDWIYLDRAGRATTGEECIAELKQYISKHPELYSGRDRFKPSLLQQLKKSWCTYRALSPETGSLYALNRIIYSTALRSAIYFKDKILRS